ncbi:hypothetical protein ACQEXU_07205 [Vibrio sp. TRT 21S02]|uniref:hypothetical protein n=1 Tax=Vibrio sp. TRT 21S02 TaxID=3418507 RepID=UPI003CF89E4B
MKQIYLALCMCGLLAGCQINSLEGEYKDVEVKVSNKDSKSGSDGEFCPPGQAKKGRC